MVGFYLKQDGQSGYILQKKADGTNHLYTIAYNQGWAIIKTDSAPGQKMSNGIDEIGDKIYSPSAIKTGRCYLITMNGPKTELSLSVTKGRSRRI